MFSGDFEKFMAMFRHKVFVCGNNMFSSGKSFRNICPCGLNAAHNFDYDIDAVVVYYFVPAVSNKGHIYAFTGLFSVSYKDFCNFKFRAYFMGKFFVLFLDYFINSCSYRTQTEYGCSDFFLHRSSPFQ